MLIRNLAALFLFTAASCAVDGARPSAAAASAQESIPAPASQQTCSPLPKGLKLYGGRRLAEVEQAGEFEMRHAGHRSIGTDSALWRQFRAELLPTDTVFEYVLDDEWTEEGKHYVMGSGGLSALRDGCTVKSQSLWET